MALIQAETLRVNPVDQAQCQGSVLNVPHTQQVNRSHPLLVADLAVLSVGSIWVV